MGMDPLVSSSLIEGGAGLLGGVLGYFGQKSANDTYLQGIDKTNEANYKIWQEQMAHNIDMYQMQSADNLKLYNLQRSNNIADWKMQQEYNTASAQRQRLEEAGLNPYMMMNGGSAGVASSTPHSANMAPASINPSQAPTMVAPQQMDSPLNVAIQQGLQSLANVSQALNLNANTDSTIKETKFQEEEVRPFWKKMKPYRQSILQNESRVAESNARVALATEDAREEVVTQEARLLRAQVFGQGLSNESQAIINYYLDGHQQIDFWNKVADLVLKNKEGEISDQKLRNLVKEAILIGEKVKTEKSIQGKNYADARYSNAKADTEIQTRDEQERLLKNQGDKVEEETKTIKNENRITDSTIEDIIRVADSKNDYLNMKYINDANTEFELNRRNNEWLDAYKVLMKRKYGD